MLWHDKRQVGDAYVLFEIINNFLCSKSNNILNVRIAGSFSYLTQASATCSQKIRVSMDLEKHRIDIRKVVTCYAV